MSALDPRTAQAWVQLLVLDVIALIVAIAGFWRWLISPIQKAIKAEETARIASVATECATRKAALDEERDSRKAADAHRDERVRELRDKMQAAIGRVEVVERFSETAVADRQALHGEIEEIRTVQQNETERLRDAERLHERSFGELKTAMAMMETRINDTVRAAIKEAASMNRGG